MPSKQDRILELEAEVVRLRTLAELVADVAYGLRVKDTEGLCLEWSVGSVKRLTGYTAEELKGVNGYRGIVLPEDLDILDDHILLLLAGQEGSIEVRIATKGGEVRWLRTKGRPLCDVDTGAVTGIIGVAWDVTEQRTADHALAQREASFRLLIEHAPDGVVITDREGQIQYMNPSPSIFSSTSFRYPCRLISFFPDGSCQIPAVLSSLPVRIRLRAGWNCISVMSFRCPSRVHTSFPFAAFHTRPSP